MPPSMKRPRVLCGLAIALALPSLLPAGQGGPLTCHAYSSLLPPQFKHLAVVHEDDSRSSGRIGTHQTTTPSDQSQQLPSHSQLQQLQQHHPSIPGGTRSRQQRIRRVTQLAMSSQAYDSAYDFHTATRTATADDEQYRNMDVNSLTADAVAPQPTLSVLEVWWLVRIEQWYEVALSHKCPFLKRRATDFIELLESCVRNVLVRPKNLALIGAPVGLRGDERTHHKTRGLSLAQVAAVLRKDWKVDDESLTQPQYKNKGYYITGRLTPAIYRDDCLFDGPDPDMPVRGLRKFLNAASQLFDAKRSHCELTSMEVRENEGTIVAQWKFQGVLRLPWRPKMPTVVGETTYHFDEEGLIQSHTETWDLSAQQAFLQTKWFQVDQVALEEHRAMHHHHHT